MRLHVMTLSLLVFGLAGLAGAKDAPLAATARDQEWADAVARAAGQAALGPVLASTDARLGIPCQRAIFVVLGKLSVRRVRFEDADSLRARLLSFASTPTVGHLVQVRGKQLVMVAGPLSDPDLALRLLDAAWSVHPRPDQVDATIFTFPGPSHPCDVVLTTRWTDGALRRNFEDLLAGLRGALVRRPHLGEEEVDACVVRDVGRVHEVRCDPSGVSAFIVTDTRVGLARRILAAIGGRPALHARAAGEAGALPVGR